VIPTVIVLLLVALLLSGGLGVLAWFRRSWEWLLLAAALVCWFLSQLAAAGAHLG